jgi:Putative peptidoglycan binding domain/ABC transporter
MTQRAAGHRAAPLLEEVGLGTLAGELDMIKNWSQRLSLGEQQRFAFARILLVEPALLFLDEATSALTYWTPAGDSDWQRGRVIHGRFGDRGFRGRDRGFRDREFRYFGGGFADFGVYGLGYPDYYAYDYPYYYPYPYYNDNLHPSFDRSGVYGRSAAGKVTSVVQSELSKRGYYQGPIDGVIGAGSRHAIRGFQTDQGLPVTGSIDSKLLRALRIGWKQLLYGREK